jgi:ribosomal protein L37AE/L43A
MDFTPIINQIMGALWYLLPISVLAWVVNSAWFKGVFGEFIINLSAKFFLDKEKYHLIKNVTLPTEDGSTQIDHIIVSIYGVFVVETKNMKGWIFGSPNQKIWSQKIYKHSNKFQNPLHQNYKHTKTLESLLELNEQQVFSVIVFVGDSTFKTKMPDNITYGKGYIQFIKSKIKPVLTNSKVIEITRIIEAGRLVPSFKTNREHVKHVRTIVAEKENRQICPQCGSKMLIREVKKGKNKGNKFWGCSNFPKCRGVVNVT